MINAPHSSHRGQLIIGLALSLLLACLLFLGLAQFQQPAYSQGLAASPVPDGLSAVATAVPTPMRTPCPSPEPPAPGEKIQIIADEEIFLSFRQANESKYLAKQLIDNPVGSTQLTASSVEFVGNGTYNPYAVTWLANTTGDLDDNGRAELLTVDRNYYSQLDVYSNVYSWSSTRDWYNSASPFTGSTVSWIDIATGNLDRVTDPRSDEEIAVAFKDNNSDIHVILLDGSNEQYYGGWIGNAPNTQMSQWTKSDLERGSVNHVTVETGDLDGDGFDDEIVVAYKDSGSDLQVEILEYNGTATLQELWRIDSRDNGRDNVASAGAGDFANKWPIDITTGDLDGDMSDEVILAFRIGSATDGDVQLWALDVTNPTNWTVDSTVWWNHPVPASSRDWAATAISVSAADLDGDGYDEVALGYNIAQTDTCSSMGGSYVCNARWIQQLVTYEYTPFAAPEYALCPAGSPTRACFRQRSGTWTSTRNYGRDSSAEGMVVIAAGDLDRDARAEIALAHYKWENDNIEVLSFDAEGSLAKRAALETELGTNRPTDFWISMGDLDKDTRWATYSDICYRKTEAQVVSVIYAPPHWPEEHVAGNTHHTGASFDYQALQASGTSTEVSSSIGSSITVGPSFHEIGASVTYGWEKEAFAEKTQTTSTMQGLKYSTCPPVACGEHGANFNGIQLVETTSNCFVYYEATAGNMDVCLPTYTRTLPYTQNWWYTTGYETYHDSWIPVGHNLAQGRSARQSSEDPSFPAPASRAVDGDVNGVFTSGHVSHTGYTTLPNSPWWEVDLGGVQWVGAVLLWNRTDLGYTNRLQDFYVFISEEEFTTDDLNALLADGDIWNTFIAGKAGRPTVVPVDHHGRYVRVQELIMKPGNYLDIAEVQVYGMPGAVDQWPKAQPTSPSSDQLTLTWRDPNLAGGQLVQTVDGKLLGVDSAKTSVAANTLTQESSLGFGVENETINGGSTSSELSLGMEVKWFEGEVSTTTSQKTSYVLSWGSDIGFYGEVSGLPAETNPPTMVDYQYDFSQYAWLQRSTSPSGVNHAFLVGGYWVPQIGPFAAGGAPPPASGGPAITPAAPVIKSPTHPNPDAWVDSDSATFTWKQPAGDPAAIAGYRWSLDQNADTVPSEANEGLVKTETYENLADGIWYLHVRALSTGGQWSETAHRAIRVDATAPEVELVVEPRQPTGDNGWHITPLTVSASAADGNGSGVAQVETSTDGATWQPYTTPLEFTADTAGTTVYARATDGAGHVSEPATTTFKIDRTAPDSHVDGGAGPGAWVAEVITDEQGNEELVLAGAIADALSGYSGFSLEYDGLDWTAASEIGSWYPFPNEPQIEVNWVFTATHEIGAGYHLFMGRAQDVAGNEEAEYEIARVLWLPKTSPDIAGSSVTASKTAVRPGEEVTFTLVARNAGPQEAHVSVTDVLPAGLSPVVETLPADASYDPDTRTLTWPATLLWPGEHVRYAFQAQADENLPATTLENEATFHASWPNTDLLSPAERQPFLDREQTKTATASVAVDPALPLGSDHTAPWALLVANTQFAKSAQVELGIPAADDARWMLLREWTPNPVSGAWETVQSSGWLPYARTMIWTLAEGQGVRYLGVWVADGSGNVSTLDEHALAYVNRYDGSETLAGGERVQYRVFLEAGMEVAVALKTLSGDPDMYIWRPRSAFWPDRGSEKSVPPGEIEDLGYQVVQRTGRFLLEVRGMGASEYELILAAAGPEMADLVDAMADKQRPAHPLVVSDPLGAGQTGVPVSQEYRVYLPVMPMK